MSVLEFPGLMNSWLDRGDYRLIGSHASKWLELCEESSTDSPFTRPEWIAAYLRAFEPRSPIVAAVAYDKGRLRAVLPLVERHTLFCGLPVRMLRGAANEHSCRFDLVRAGGEDGDRAVQGIWNVLKALPDWDLIELPYVPEGGAAEQLVQLAEGDGFLTGKYESYRSPYVSLMGPHSEEAVLLDGDFRRGLQRRMRRAREKWDVRLRRIDSDDPTELQRFYDLEASGWKGKKRTAIACSDSTRRFYNHVASGGSHAGYFSLYFLEFDGRVVAGHFGLSYKGRYYSPKVAYDEAFASYGPGQLIIDGILRDIHTRGFDEFDFLGPWMDWKGNWAQQGRTHFFCYIFRPGVLGRTLHSTKLKLMTALRRITPLREIAQLLPKSLVT